MNISDSERVASVLESMKYKIVLIALNTFDQKSFEFIDSIPRYDPEFVEGSYFFKSCFNNQSFPSRTRRSTRYKSKIRIIVSLFKS